MQLLTRSLLLAACVTVGSIVTSGQVPAPSSDAAARANQVLADARAALGGENLAAVKTLVATGRTRRVRGDNLVPIEFEIFIELPDKFLRVDEFPAEDADPTSSGFNGEDLIQNPPPPPGPGPMPGGAPAAGPQRAAPPRAAAPGSPDMQGPVVMGRGGQTGPGGRGPAMGPRRARIATLKQEYARLALGLFAASPAYPLTFSYAAVAEAPQGQADVLEAKGEGNVMMRYFIDRKTRLPIMVTWTTPPTNVIVTVPGQPPPRTVAPGAVVVTGPAAPPPNAPKEETDKYAKDVLALRTKAQTTPVEHRLYFAEYREVDGVRFPFRLRRAIGSETTEETTFDRFRINARIDTRRFQPVK